MSVGANVPAGIFRPGDDWSDRAEAPEANQRGGHKAYLGVTRLSDAPPLNDAESCNRSLQTAKIGKVPKSLMGGGLFANCRFCEIWQDRLKDSHPLRQSSFSMTNRSVEASSAPVA